MCSIMDIKDWLILASTSGIGALTAHRLIQQYGLVEVNERLQRDPNSFGGKATKKPSIQRVEEALLWQSQAKNRYIISFDDPAYPSLLKEISDPPLVLFAEGQLDCLHTPMLAIVGSRHSTPGGLRIAYDFAQQISQQDFTIVSGLALGIDTQAHLGTLEQKKTTVAVLGTGLKHIYPQRNIGLALQIKDRGCLLTEFFPDTPPVSYNFPKRNRILSGLCYGVVIVEAALKSGSLITARLAAEQGREVFAVPGSILSKHSQGCHKLIQQGAKLTTSIEDIFDELSHVNTVLSKNEKKVVTKCDVRRSSVLDYIGFESTSIDRIVELSQMKLDNVLEHLLDLECQGDIVAVPGGYSRIRRS